MTKLKIAGIVGGSVATGIVIGFGSKIGYDAMVSEPIEVDGKKIGRVKKNSNVIITVEPKPKEEKKDDSKEDSKGSSTRS